MLVKLEDCPALEGGRGVLLCDDSGKPLPMQMAVKLEEVVGDRSTITVTFAIDGKQIRFAD